MDKRTFEKRSPEWLRTIMREIDATPVEVHRPRCISACMCKPHEPLCAGCVKHLAAIGIIE